MTDLPWAPVNGAIVISSRAWENIPAELHGALQEAIDAVAKVAQIKIRQSGTESIAEMQARGLSVVPLDAEALTSWRQEAQAAYPALRKNSSVPELFDQVLRFSAEYKQAQEGKN
jgi:TRAP-type C4-dicarboxylate transport system substrate-binding protein